MTSFRRTRFVALFATRLPAFALASLALVACSSDGAPGGASPAPTPTASVTTVAETTPTAATSTGTPGSTPTRPPLVATPSATPEPPLLRGDITGWFTDPRPATNVLTRTLGARPASPFAAYDRQSAQVVLYDVQTMTERPLGLGGYANFSPDGTRLAWVTGDERRLWTDLRLLELRTGDQRSLGRARSLRWVDDDTIVVHEVGNEMALIDVATGVHRPAGGVNLNPVERAVEQAGYRLERVAKHEPYPYWRSTYRVTHLASGTAFTFDAYRAVLAPDGAMVMATVSEPATRKRPIEGPDVGVMMSNIFAVDPATRQATFIATAQPSYPNWPFAASATHVIWQDDACGEQRTPRLHDRRTGTLAEVRGPLEWPAVFTPAGAIASGTFGAKALIDAETLQYLVVLPGGFSDVRWSPDYRHAVVSEQLGHGGLCG